MGRKGVSLLVVLVAVSAACVAVAGSHTKQSINNIKNKKYTGCEVYLWLHSAATEEAIEAAFVATSDPDSPSFRRFLTPADVATLVAAPPEAVETVVAWATAAAGASDRVSVLPSGDYVSVRFESCAAAVAVFGAPNPRVRFGHRALPTIPRAVARFVRAALLPAVSVARLAAEKGAQRGEAASLRLRLRGGAADVAGDVGVGAGSSSSSGSQGTTQSPRSIRPRYGLPDAAPTGAALANFSQGVAEFEGEQFYPASVATFNARYGAPKPRIHISGPNNGGYFGEGAMDLEYMQTIAPGVRTWWIAKDSFDLVAWGAQAAAIGPPPSVLSVSWGSGESGWDPTGMAADSAEFRKLGLLGISVLVASGDQGTGATGSCSTFDPTWPASSPYVTAVGGTYSETNSSAEIGAQFSGGGFSSVVAAPAYQQAAIAAYFATANASLPPAGLYTKGGRGTPDVSAIASNVEIYASAWGTGSGTSAATPVFSAVTSLITMNRILESKPPLGFLNPALYKLGRVGFDVVQGNNQYSGCPAGFTAAKGWDPVTGLGTPSYEFLLNNL